MLGRSGRSDRGRTVAAGEKEVNGDDHEDEEEGKLPQKGAAAQQEGGFSVPSPPLFRDATPSPPASRKVLTR